MARKRDHLRPLLGELLFERQKIEFQLRQRRLLAGDIHTVDLAERELLLLQRQDLLNDCDDLACRPYLGTQRGLLDRGEGKVARQ